jgi:hypothetical protein
MNHSDLDVPGLFREQLKKFRSLVTKPFAPREAAVAYITAGYSWADIPRAYQALVRAGQLPDVGLIWRIAGIAFREQPENNAHLRRWADTLGPDNWRQAKAEAEAAADGADRVSTTAAPTAAGHAAHAAVYAAYAADAADAISSATTYAAAISAARAAARAAAQAAANASAATSAARSASKRVQDEIIEMIISEVERVLEI